MRPAREGRENDIRGGSGDEAPRASMRPAREGRENTARGSGLAAESIGFNEARP